MEFGINYSRTAAELLADGRISIDRFKTPDWPWMIEEAARSCPVSVHFNLTAGNGNLRKTKWDQVASFIDQTATPYVNLHLSPTRKHFPGIDNEAITEEHVHQLVAGMQADIQEATGYFGAERVIIENVPYRGSQDKVLRPAVEPRVISEVLELTGCGLLLDISHARMAARQLGMEEHQYMSALPVHSLRELHFTGLHFVEGMWRDHYSALDDDWPVLDWVLERIRLGEWSRPWLLAFEYGGVGEKFDWRTDPQVIADQAPLIYTRIKEI